MENYYISVNQLAEFSASTAKAKIKILEQQIKPNKVLIPWYQGAKSTIRQYFKNVNDHNPLFKGIQKITEKVPQNKRQLSDKTTSIEALKKIIDLHIEKQFKGIKYEIVALTVKDLVIRNVSVGMSPELIFKTKIKGKTSYGGIKIHISKNKPFDLDQCQKVSTMLMQYIKKNIAGNDEVVLPEFCFCLDVFSGRLVPATDKNRPIIKSIQDVCEEIKSKWPKSI